MRPVCESHSRFGGQLTVGRPRLGPTSFNQSQRRPLRRLAPPSSSFSPSSRVITSPSLSACVRASAGDSPPSSGANSRGANDYSRGVDPLLAGGGAALCPVPEEQQPINEYAGLLDTLGFQWPLLGAGALTGRLAALGLAVAALVGWPVASITFNPQSEAVQCTLGALGGGQLAATLAALRLYLGWSYVGGRLSSAKVEYEETGWYDGQVWVKTPELLARDRLLAAYQVKPALLRLRAALLSLGLSLAATTGLLLLLPPASSASPPASSSASSEFGVAAALSGAPYGQSAAQAQRFREEAVRRFEWPGEEEEDGEGEGGMGSVGAAQGGVEAVAGMAVPGCGPVPGEQ